MVKYQPAIEIRVRKANQEIVQETENPKLKIGEPDIAIISCFLNEDIKDVYTFDKGFGATCKKLGIEPLILPAVYISRALAVKRNMQEIKESEGKGC